MKQGNFFCFKRLVFAILLIGLLMGCSDGSKEEAGEKEMEKNEIAGQIVDIQSANGDIFYYYRIAELKAR